VAQAFLPVGNVGDAASKDGRNAVGSRPMANWRMGL